MERNIWVRAMKRHPNVCYYLCLTLAVLILTALIYSPMLLDGKSLVYQADALRQEVPLTAYTGEWIRKIAANLADGNLSAPMFDFNIGLGEDIPMIVFGTPLNILAALVPVSGAIGIYEFIIIFSNYLCAVTFSIYSLYLKRSYFATLLASLIYAFCGFNLVDGIWHIGFICLPIMLPILFWGYEKVLLERKATALASAVFLAGLCGFYFLYMLSILLFVYALLRYFEQRKGKTFKEFFRVLGKSLLSYGIGVMLAGIVLVPWCYAFLQSPRSVGDVSIPAVYSVPRYISYLINMITPHISIELGFVPLVILAAICVVFCKKEGAWSLKWSLGIYTVFMLTPFFGSLFNGFGYVSNRWMFAVSFLMANITGFILPELFLARFQVKVLACLSVGGYFCLYLYQYIKQRGNGAVEFLAGFGMLCITVVVFLLIQDLKKTVWKKALVLSVTCGCIVIYAFGVYSPMLCGLSNDCAPRDTVLEQAAQLPIRSLKASAALFERVGIFHYGANNLNSSMMQQIPSTSIYFSICNGSIPQAMYLLENPQMNHTFQIWGLDGRTFLNALSNVGRYAAWESEHPAIPYGFQRIEDTDPNEQIYENQYTLPFGYTYSSAMNIEDWKKLDVLKKQEAMMQSVVLNETDADGDTSAFTSFKIENVSISLNDVSWENGVVQVEKPGGYLILTFDRRSKSEIYVNFRNMDFDGSGTGSYAVRVSSMKNDTEGTYKIFNASSSSSSWDTGQKNFSVNMGYEEEGVQRIKVLFNDVRQFKLEGIDIVCQPMDRYPEQITALKADVLEDVQMTQNRISGTIRTDQKKFLCLSIPYSDGWTAYVDGEPAELQQANIMYMGLFIPAGEHQIELHYCTPGIEAGILVSGLGVIAFLGCLFWEKAFRNKRGVDGAPSGS